MRVNKDLLSLKKKKQKDVHPSTRSGGTAGAAAPHHASKVFWFFLSKKNILPVLLLTAAAPAMRPLRDVDVTYRVPVPNTENTSLLQRLRWSVALGRERVDLPTSGNWVVVDTRAGTVTMVHDDSRQVIEVPAAPGSVLPGPAPGADAQRVGAATVAGVSCTEWRTRDTIGRETVACLTADGVLLRAREGERTLLEAVEVRYAPQDESVFTVPRGYATVKR
jgi:hypothetical protein